MMKLPVYSEISSYRADWDGSDFFMAPSLQMSLCLFCGAWYRWDEVHALDHGCYPPRAGLEVRAINQN